MSSRFEQVDDEQVYDGRIASVHRRRFRHEDGEVVDREIVVHPGAVAVVCHDGEQLFLVRQPREAIGSPDLLEVPAGKLDEEGEEPLETAKRELAEEIGKAADTWEHLTTFHTSPGFTDEAVHVYLATDLRNVEQPAVEEDERIELVTWPLTDVDGAVAATSDSKTIIGLMLLKARLQ